MQHMQYINSLYTSEETIYVIIPYLTRKKN